MGCCDLLDGGDEVYFSAGTDVGIIGGGGTVGGVEDLKAKKNVL